jgi:hypothetical protein
MRTTVKKAGTASSALSRALSPPNFRPVAELAGDERAVDGG